MCADLRVVQGQYLQDLLDQPRAIENTLEALNMSPELSELAHRLHSGTFQRIVLTGMGSSFHALHPLNLQLIDHGFTTIMVETSELIHYQTRFFDPNTLFIAVSQSGESAEMVRFTEMNRTRSAVIAVTNTPESALARKATAAVLTRAGQEFSVSCKTYVTTLIVLQWLGHILCQRDAKPSRSELKNAASAAGEYLAEWEEHVITLATVLRGVRQLFLVGRGASLAAVGTGALIVKESDHFHAEGMSSAAFRHGPFEMLSQETFVIVFSGDKKTRDLNSRLVADIQQGGGKAELAGENSGLKCFQLKEYESNIRSIVEILPIQMITLALAFLGGREPGRFELATKVTTKE
jgi:glutamine---fructose-6-phosphate transaminase (isomerizing)